MTLSVIKATKVLPWLDVIVMALPAPVMDETAAPVARIVCARVRFRLDDTWSPHRPCLGLSGELMPANT
jgi:hypothetical protein